MKPLGIFIKACVVLAAAQAAAVALYAALLLAVVWGVIVHPREAFGLLGLSFLTTLVARQPLGCLAVAALMAILAGVGRNR